MEKVKKILQPKKNLKSETKATGKKHSEKTIEDAPAPLEEQAP